MKTPNLVFLWCWFFCLALPPDTASAQEIYQGQELHRVGSPPAFGTFWFVQNKAPYPFDPFHGALPVYEVGRGIFLIDDTSLFDSLWLDGGGMMSLMSGPTPTGAAGTNSGTTNMFCNSLTNFTVGYLYSTNGLSLGIAPTTNPWIALTIQTATTNAPYDVFGTTNMAELALPALNRTNWTWLTRANGGVTNFTWGQTNWCERYFQLGKTNDLDGDGLTDALEGLMLKTSPTNANSPRKIYEDVLANQSPSAWFKLNDSSFTNSASSGGLGLTNLGGLWDPDAFAIGNGAYSFSGTSDKLVVTNDAIGGGTSDATNQGSFTLLFKALTRKATSKRYVLSQGTSTSTASGNAISVYFDGTNNGALTVGVGPVEQAILADTNLVRGAWYYLAVTCNETNASNEVRWYLGRVGSPALQSNSLTLGQAKKFGNNGSITLGNKENGTSAFRESATTNGSIDQVAFWQRELTETEVNAQFNTFTPLFHGPSKVFDLSRWNILLPVNKTNQLNTNHLALEIHTGWLNSGFRYVDPTNWTQKYFYLSGDNKMVFEVPWNGARSSANAGPRSELRETTPDGNRYNWQPLGTNTLDATCVVESAGTNNSRKLIIGQIHGENASDPPVAINYNFPALKQVSATYKTNSNGSGNDFNLILATNVNVLDSIRYKVLLRDNGTNVSLDAVVFVNGVTNIPPQSVPLASSPSDAWHTATFYFKAGCYYPSPTTNSSAKVTFSNLTATHQP